MATLSFKNKNLLWHPLSVFGLLTLFTLSSPSVGNATPALVHAQIKSDQELVKDTSNWRSKVPYLPFFGVNLGFGFVPAYFAPANQEAQPYVSSSLSLGMGISLMNFGVQGYWSDLSFRVSWGLSKALTDNIGSANIARQVYSRDVGFSISKTLFVERYSGIQVDLGLSSRIPASLDSMQSTLITSIATSLSVSKTLLMGYLTLGYTFSTNFNFFMQDSGLYNPRLAGIPGLNERWGMNHSFAVGVRIIQGLSVNMGLSINVGYSFADNYSSPDGPQVFGAENMTEADLATFALNEGNSYGIGISLNYRFNRYLGFNLGYRNGGSQFEWQYDNDGRRNFVVRNPFKLENGSFAFSISGNI